MHVGDTTFTIFDVDACAGATYRTYDVPAGVSSIGVELWGAGGAPCASANVTVNPNGGAGAYVAGVLTVAPSEQLRIVVGSGGQRINAANPTKTDSCGSGGRGLELGSDPARLDAEGVGGGGRSAIQALVIIDPPRGKLTYEDVVTAGGGGGSIECSFQEWAAGVSGNSNATGNVGGGAATWTGQSRRGFDQALTTAGPGGGGGSSAAGGGASSLSGGMARAGGDALPPDVPGTRAAGGGGGYWGGGGGSSCGGAGSSYTENLVGAHGEQAVPHLYWIAPGNGSQFFDGAVAHGNSGAGRVVIIAPAPPLTASPSRAPWRTPTRSPTRSRAPTPSGTRSRSRTRSSSRSLAPQSASHSGSATRKAK